MRRYNQRQLFLFPVSFHLKLCFELKFDVFDMFTHNISYEKVFIDSLHGEMYYYHACRFIWIYFIAIISINICWEISLRYSSQLNVLIWYLIHEKYFVAALHKMYFIFATLQLNDSFMVFINILFDDTFRVL